MKTVNTVPEILSTFPDSHFDKQRWRDYAGAIHPELPKLCEEDTAKYEFEKDVLPVIETVLGEPERIRNLGSRFERVVAELQERLPVLFDKECEVTVVLYLGLCNAAGWVTFLGGKKVVLLGVEKVLELNWDSEEKLKALLYHEIGHIWHEIYGNLEFPAHTQSRQSMLQLWQEGIAMVCEQILSKDERYYHQDENGWLAWCQEAGADDQGGIRETPGAGGKYAGFLWRLVRFLRLFGCRLLSGMPVREMDDERE